MHKTLRNRNKDTCGTKTKVFNWVLILNAVSNTEYRVPSFCKSSHEKMRTAMGKWSLGCTRVGGS